MIEGEVTLRGTTVEDEEFLSCLYVDTRRREVEAWGWPPEQQEMFLRMQFGAQRRSYRAGFPDATDRVINLEGTPVGRILVTRKTGEIRLIDIALLEQHRNRGIGTGLLIELQQECEAEGGIMYLEVLQGNPAIRLYQRLGFTESGADAMYVQMEWKPSQAREGL